MAKQKKKIILIIFLITVALALTIALLVKNSNRIIKNELEKALGKNFSVERISLTWGAVEAYGIRFKQGTEVTAEAGKLSIKASFIGLLKKQYSISSFVLERPVLKLSITKEGKVSNPFALAAEKKGKSASASVLPSFEINNIFLNDGEIQVQDERFPPAENNIHIRKVNAQLNNFSFPLKNIFSEVKISADVEGNIISGIINCSGNINLKTMAADAKVECQNLSAFQINGKEPSVKAEKITLAAVREEAPSERIILPEAVLVKPYFRVETDSKGNLFSFFQAAKGKSTEEPQGKRDKGSDIILKKIIMKNGTLLYLDGKISSPPHLTRVEAIDMTMTDISMPLKDNWSDYSFTGRIPGRGSTGILKWKGKMNFKTLDANSRMELRSLDITNFKPYFLKKGDADVSKGMLDLNMDIRVRSELINAPGKAVIKNLEFQSGKGIGEKFLGVPRSLVLNLLKTSNNELPLEFTLAGKLNDPKFNITENIVKRFTVGIAQKLGLSVVEVGEKVVVKGSESVKEIGRSLKSIGKGVEKFFRK